jgi:hypothetical protein
MRFQRKGRLECPSSHRCQTSRRADEPRPRRPTCSRTATAASCDHGSFGDRAVQTWLAVLTACPLGFNSSGPCSHGARNRGSSRGACAVEFSPPCVPLELANSCAVRPVAAYTGKPTGRIGTIIRHRPRPATPDTPHRRLPVLHAKDRRATASGREWLHAVIRPRSTAIRQPFATRFALTTHY